MNQHSIKRNNIKEAAKKLFFQFGLSKTSMNDIADQCKLAKPSIYYYFPSKESIFDEIVIDEATRFMNKVEQKIPQNLTADQKIAAFFRILYKELKNYYNEICSLPETMHKNYPHGKPITEKINHIFKTKLRPLLTEGQEQEIFEIDDLDTTLASLVLLTQFINLEWMGGVPEEERDRIIEKSIQVLLNGLKRR